MIAFLGMKCLYIVLSISQFGLQKTFKRALAKRVRVQGNPSLN